jgi:hypothetical protein
MWKLLVVIVRSPFALFWLFALTVLGLPLAMLGIVICFARHEDNFSKKI